MDLIEMNYNEAEVNHGEDMNPATFVDHMPPNGSSEGDGLYEDELIPPRLGDDYQVEIPPLLTESEGLIGSYKANITIMGDENPFGLGLPIEIAWFPLEANSGKYQGLESRSFGVTENKKIGIDQGNDNFCGIMVNSHGDALHPQLSKVCGLIPQGSSDFYNKTTNCMHQLRRTITNDVGESSVQPNVCKFWTPLPLTSPVPWTSAELQSFLLGLYIFGKNLSSIRKFMGTKEMGDVLSFYYGKFYRSNTYRRWSECRKMRSRRFVHGQRIFTGWRQQELLSRMLPSVSKDSQGLLMEVFRGFNEGKTVFFEFISSLKAIVSMETLVAAVGIGKGKDDLTGIVLDPNRVNHVPSVRTDIPIGKACSTLAAGDIIKFLTGNFRLSKARSNDLFWEAVWPRLLARGWHSEQPKDLAGSKGSLVFLIPGVRKFSRRKLVKGDHYFDSISDVLNKVASEPRLLELELDGVNGGSNIENNCRPDGHAQLEPNGNGEPVHLRRRDVEAQGSMKFTIVDTSLVKDDEPCKVWSMRSLPLDTSCNHPTPPSSSSSDETSVESSPEKPDSTCNSAVVRGTRYPKISRTAELEKKARPLRSKGPGPQPDLPVFPGTVLCERKIVESDFDDQRGEFFIYEQPAPRDQPSSHGKQPNYLSPLVRRQRLFGSSNLGPCYVFNGDHQMVKEEPEDHKFRLIEAQEVASSNSGATSKTPFYSFPAARNQCKEQAPVSDPKPVRHSAPSRRRKRDNGPSQGSLDGGAKESAPRKNDSSKVRLNWNELLPKESEAATAPPKTSFDLNLPYHPPDSTLEETSTTDGFYPKEISFSLNQGGSNNSSQTSTTYYDIPGAAPPTATNSLRQSTRSRPLTTKVLEALASGLLSTTTRRGKGPKGALFSRNSSSGRQQTPPAAAATNFASTVTDTMPDVNFFKKGSFLAGRLNGGPDIYKKDDT